jgi:hypothetical protein
MTVAAVAPGQSCTIARKLPAHIDHLTVKDNRAAGFALPEVAQGMPHDNRNNRFGWPPVAARQHFPAGWGTAALQLGCGR